MKKIFNGKKYDTDTATLICEGSWDRQKFQVFMKKDGTFFAWSIDEHDGYYQYGKISDINSSVAKKYAETFLTAEQYEEIFGEVAE